MNCHNLKQEYSYVPSEVLDDKEKVMIPTSELHRSVVKRRFKLTALLLKTQVRIVSFSSFFLLSSFTKLTAYLFAQNDSYIQKLQQPSAHPHLFSMK
jgi:hypothetical protein